MSTASLDRWLATQPRMKDYLKPEDLDTDACIDLAATVLGEQADELARAAQRAARCPSKENLGRLADLRRFYKSDWYTVLSCGMVDGETAMANITRDALHRRRRA